MEEVVEIVDNGAAAVMAKFPDEIWTIIFHCLQNSSKDLLNCTRVCRKWERILRPDQCNWMFDQIFPHIFPCLNKRDILTVRQVGRRWHKVVDEYVEDHESRLPFDENRTDIGRRTLSAVLNYKNLKWNSFYEREHLLRFMNLMGQPDTNPVFGRSLWLEFQEETEDEDENFQENSKYWPTVFQFLSLYGRHVWYFGLGTYGTRNTYARFLYLLNNCLSLMPNLKTLQVFGWINESGEDEENNLSVEDIPAYLENHPLPVLQVLTTLEISNMSGLPSAVLDHMISRHSEQLKCLHLSEWEESRLVTDIKLPQLKELNIDVSRYRAMEMVENLLRHLDTSPLGKVSISFSSLESQLDLSRLFSLIGQFGSTLRSLRLTVIPGVPRDMSKNKPVGNNLTSQLHLTAPNLQALHLEGFNELSLSFITHLSSIKYLEIRPLSVSVRRTCYPDENIDLYQYLQSNEVYNSKIWLDLPKLKTIYFEFCNQRVREFVNLSYFRAAYEYVENLKKCV